MADVFRGQAARFVADDGSGQRAESTMKTRTLLGMIFGTLMALVFGRAALSHGELDRAMDGYASLVERNERTGAALARVAALAINLETGVRGWLLTSDATFLEPYRRAAHERAASLDNLERAVRDDEQPAHLARRLRAQLDGWESQVARPLTAPSVFALLPSERLALNRDGKARMDDIRATVDEMNAWLATRRAAQSGLVASYRDEIGTRSWAFTLLLVGVVAASALVLVRFVERPLTGLLSYASEIARGELGRLDGGGVAEIRDLHGAMKAMAVGLSEERKREGRFTELMTALSAGGSLATVASASLRLLVRHQRATAGVLWVARGEASEQGAARLELAASQAVDVGTLPRGGDALAREVHASCEPRFLDGLGDDAGLVVRTAFVDAIPKALFAAPVRAGAKIVAVVELAGAIGPADLPDTRSEPGAHRSRARKRDGGRAARGPRR